MLLQPGADTVRLKALAQEVAIETQELALVADLLASAQPLRQRCLQQGIVVDRLEGVVDGAARSSARDAGLFDLPTDAEPAATSHGCFGSCNRSGDAGIVASAMTVMDRTRTGQTAAK